MWKFGFFFYSKKQDKITQAVGSFRKNYARQIVTRKVVRYTEWRHNPFDGGKWNDYKLVAIGFYDHSD